MQELGTEIKQAREQKGLTLEQVQQDTKIRTRYLEAIEQGDLSALPGLVYARGFIKSYAEYLGMNGQELLERHNLIQTSSETAPVESLRRAAKKSSTVEVSKSSIGNSRLLPQIVAGVGVLAVLVAAYVLLVKNESPKDTGQAQTQATANAQDVTPTTQATPAPAPAPTPAPQPQPEPPKPQATVTQSAKESNRTLYAVGNTDNLSLVLTAQDNCWIQVTADGKVVETGIVKVGESRTWTATKDIAVLTGKSKFITLKMNDLPVSFEPQLRGYTYEFQKK